MIDLARFIVKWIDRGREPQNAPDPDFPTGIDIDISLGRPSCKTDLPYPAARCGNFYVECSVCGVNALLSTAGRSDDPRSVRMACKKPEAVN